MLEEDLQAPETLETSHICEGGNRDGGTGLLLIMRKSMEGVPAGEVLEIRSTEISVKEDLPAWCRMTENPYLGWRQAVEHNKYFVRRGEAEQAEELAYEQARDYRWQARVHWADGMQAKVFCRNHSWRVGQPASFDVQDAAPSAVEYVLGALGACLAMGFQIRASRRNVEIEELEISLSGQIDNIFVFLGTEQAGHSGFKQIRGTIYVDSDADEEVLKELWEETIAASPVTSTLTRNIEMNVALRLV